MKSHITFLVLAAAASTTASAAIFEFDLQGIAGSGLLAGNEVTAGGAPATIVGTPGSGGEIGTGFRYDDVTKVLEVNFSWTALQGGAATGFHIHGPVAAANPQLGTASVLHNISSGTAGGGAVPSYTIVNNVSGSGSVVGTISNIPLSQEADLLAGRWYVNVHSTLNPGGEIRGNLVPVPEPAEYAFATALLLGATALFRRRAS